MQHSVFTNQTVTFGRNIARKIRAVLRQSLRNAGIDTSHLLDVLNSCLHDCASLLSMNCCIYVPAVT